MIDFPMNPELFGASGIPPILIILWIVVEIIWLASVVRVANKATKEPLDRVVWLMVILFLNIMGTILYWLFAQCRETSQKAARVANADAERERAIKERANRGAL